MTVRLRVLILLLSAMVCVAINMDWVATVDGAPAPVLAANGAFKAVPVPSGSHRVALTYRPWRYVVAFAVRTLAIVGGLVMVLWLRRAAPSRAAEGMESAPEALVR